MTELTPDDVIRHVKEMFRNDTIMRTGNPPNELAQKKFDMGIEHLRAKAELKQRNK